MLFTFFILKFKISSLPLNNIVHISHIPKPKHLTYNHKVYFDIFLGYQMLFIHFFHNILPHKIRSPYEGHCYLVRVFQHFRDPKIPQFNCVIGCQENVGTFDVPMQDFFIMNVIKGQNDLNNPIQKQFFREILIFLLFLIDMIIQISL